MAALSEFMLILAIAAPMTTAAQQQPTDENTAPETGEKALPSVIGADALTLWQLDDKTRQRITTLEQSWRGDDGAEAAATELAQIAAALFDRSDSGSAASRTASSIARSIFLSSSPISARKQVFGIYRAGFPREYLQHVREVTIIVPGVTCHGRLVDSFRRNIADTNDNVWAVSIVNSFQTLVTESAAADGVFVLGSDAYVTFTVDRSTTPDDLRQLLVSSRAYDVTHWKILVAEPVAPR